MLNKFTYINIIYTVGLYFAWALVPADVLCCEPSQAFLRCEHPEYVLRCKDSRRNDRATSAASSPSM